MFHTLSKKILKDIKIHSGILKHLKLSVFDFLKVSYCLKISQAARKPDFSEMSDMNLNV